MSSPAELLKRSWKTSKKAVDKQRRICYPNKVAAEHTDCEFKNFWKKCLTNEMKFAIIATFRRKRRVPCKLNNVTKRKHQTETVLRDCNQEVARLGLSQLPSLVTIKNEAMTNSSVKDWLKRKLVLIPFYWEFDPGSGRTLAACLTHASRTECSWKSFRTMDWVT